MATRYSVVLTFSLILFSAATMGQGAETVSLKVAKLESTMTPDGETFCYVSATAINNSSETIGTLAVTVQAYDESDYLIGPILWVYDNMRPQKRMTDRTILPGALCKEIQSLELDSLSQFGGSKNKATITISEGSLLPIKL